MDGDPSPEDGNGHGSNVAGIVGAALNDVGVVGVAPRTRLMPVRVLDSYGDGTTSGVANGIIYAADRGAKILNMSLGRPMDDQTHARCGQLCRRHKRIVGGRVGRELRR